MTLPASRFASHSIAPHAASAPRYRLCTIFGASDPLGIISQGIRTGSEPLRKEARLLGPALCQLVAQQPAAEPTQASTNRHSHASLQSTCQPRALHMTRIASRPARACLGTAQHLFFRCFRPARTWAPGQAYWNEDGIISSHVLSTAVRPQHSILHLHTAEALHQPGDSTVDNTEPPSQSSCSWTTAFNTPHAP